jgi:hypothetical protein
MGLPERNRTSDEVDAIPCPVLSATKAGNFPGEAMEATVATTEPLRKFLRLKESFFS